MRRYHWYENFLQLKMVMLQFKQLSSEAKRISSLLHLLNDYQANAAQDDLKLNKEKVEALIKFLHSQLLLIENRLIHANGDREVRIIETRDHIPRTKEQKSYATAYNSFN